MTDYIAALADPMNPYHREATSLALALSDSRESTVVDGVIRWRSNGRVPPVECVALAIHIGEELDVVACDAARAIEQRSAIEAWNTAQAARLPEIDAAAWARFVGKA